MDELIVSLKQRITESLNLPPERWEGVGAADPLFGEGLGLDSIDALEIIVMLERDYDIRLTEPTVDKRVFSSLDSIAQFIREQRDACDSPPSQ